MLTMTPQNPRTSVQRFCASWQPGASPARKNLAANFEVLSLRRWRRFCSPVPTGASYRSALGFDQHPRVARFPVRSCGGYDDTTRTHLARTKSSLHRAAADGTGRQTCAPCGRSRRRLNRNTRISGTRQIRERSLQPANVVSPSRDAWGASCSRDDIRAQRSSNAATFVSAG